MSAVTTDANLGGDDRVSLVQGDNVILAGDGQDRVQTGSGTDYIVGDNGEISFDDAGVVTRVATTFYEQGNHDNINAGDGLNFVLAGIGNDAIISGDNDDWIVADNGEINFVDGIARSLMGTDTVASTAGDNTITSGRGMTALLLA
nr:hypothetical protein [Vibrio taketomensis]